MPKQIINSEDILTAAISLVRKTGFEGVNARAIASFMNCSVQPIYSYFKNMDDLKEAIYNKAFEFYNSFILERSDSNDYILSMGKANVSFAKTEANLFRLLFLTKLDGIKSFKDIYSWIGKKEVVDLLVSKLNTSEEKAKNIYIMMMVFTHGIATMLATESASIAEEEIGALLEKARTAFSLL